MAINQATWWTRFGKFAYGASTIVTALATTIEDEVEDAVQEIAASLGIEYDAIREGVLTGLRSLQSSGSSAITACAATPVQRLLIQTIKDDNPQESETIDDAIAELIVQMTAAGESIDSSTPSVVVTFGASNVGNGRLVTSVRREDGKLNEHILAEDIECYVSAAPSSGLASLTLKGEPSVSVTSYNWPRGSGASTTIESKTSDASDNKVTNGGFETESTSASHLPSGWICSVGTLGTTVKMTSVEVQTLTVSGTPTGGYYILHFTDRNGKVQSTAPLAYNASGTDVQTALRLLTGLGSITVVTSGTTPNFAHTVTMTGVTNPAQFTRTNGMTGGSSPDVTPATTTAGSANVVKGARSVEFDSDGAQLTTLNVPVTLAAKTQYAINLWLLADVVPAAGVITVDLVDGIGGTVVQDDKGRQNSVHAICTSLTTSFKAFETLLASTNEVQTFTITGTPTGGTFTLTYNGQTTGNIAYNASAATVELALEALTNIGTDNVVCGGGALPGAAVTITFQNALGSQDVPMLTANIAGLTGGTPAYTVVETTRGNSTSATFRTPSNMPDNIYLRIRISTAISNTTSVFIDEVVMVPMTKLYAGGVYVTHFTGPTFWELGDTVKLAVANDAAGLIHTWCNRLLDLRSKELLIPTNQAGQETQLDSLVN